MPGAVWILCKKLHFIIKQKNPIGFLNFRSIFGVRSDTYLNVSFLNEIGSCHKWEKFENTFSNADMERKVVQNERKKSKKTVSI